MSNVQVIEPNHWVKAIDSAIRDGIGDLKQCYTLCCSHNTLMHQESHDSAISIERPECLFHGVIPT